MTALLQYVQEDIKVEYLLDIKYRGVVKMNNYFTLRNRGIKL